MADSLPTISKSRNPEIFKGIALFTPGGDLVYCIDTEKQNHWHLQLCIVLQEMLGLAEPPHFLVPCYTATIDRWLDPRTQQVQTFAEACPLILRHQSLLNALFGVGDLTWSNTARTREICDPIVLASYQKQFPQLWKDHDLVVRFERVESLFRFQDNSSTLAWSPSNQRQPMQGYVLRLFVSGGGGTTEQILQTLHQLLEESLQHPYTLKVVDIRKHPELAEANQVAATPTLVKVWPHPVRRIVGDFTNPAKLRQALGSLEATDRLLQEPF